MHCISIVRSLTWVLLSYLGVFTFCTCCKILICLVCIVLVLSGVVCNCCWLAVCIVVVILYVLLSSYVYLL